MKLFTRILLATTLSTSLSFAGLVNGISVIINNEPITLYEIYKYAQHFKISKKEALDVLVRQKLEDSQIKKLEISADIFEVDAYIQNMARQNGMSEFDFIKMLKSKNVDMKTYRSDLKAKIKRDKLYKGIIQEKVGTIDEADLKAFYETNKKEFAVAKEYVVKSYSSASQESLDSIAQNPMLRVEGVEIEERTLKNDKVDPKLIALLAQTKTGSYTPALNIENKFVMFYVKEKVGVSYVSFEEAKNSIYNIVYKQKEQKAISDYFEKLKSSANVKVLRNPS